MKAGTFNFGHDRAFIKSTKKTAAGQKPAAVFFSLIRPFYLPAFFMARAKASAEAAITFSSTQKASLI